jgi:hypothetical protein
MTKQIDNALGLRTVPTVYQEENTLPSVSTSNEQADNDVENARDGLYDALDMSKQAVQDMITIAQQSQHPKAYEVLNSAIKTMADISIGLADLQIKKQRLVGKPVDQKVVNNNLFVGSTADLQKMLDQLDGTEEDEDDE